MTEDAVWSRPNFLFTVDFGDGTVASFQEVTGLAREAQPIAYRAGNSPVFSTVKMPGLGKVGNITMRKGVFPASDTLWGWFTAISLNTIKRQTVVIRLCDANGATKVTWTLTNAYPAKVATTDLKSVGNEVAVESIELAYETLSAAVA